MVYGVIWTMSVYNREPELAVANISTISLAMNEVIEPPTLLRVFRFLLSWCPTHLQDAFIRLQHRLRNEVCVMSCTSRF